MQRSGKIDYPLHEVSILVLEGFSKGKQDLCSVMCWMLWGSTRKWHWKWSVSETNSNEKEGEWLTQFCCSTFHTCFHSPFGNHQQCSDVWPPSLANLVSTLLLMISRPPSRYWRMYEKCKRKGRVKQEPMLCLVGRWDMGCFSWNDETGVYSVSCKHVTWRYPKEKTTWPNLLDKRYKRYKKHTMWSKDMQGTRVRATKYVIKYADSS